MSDTFEVSAAGGVVWRPGPPGIAVLVVHRPRYDDWSLPKGKCDDGESFEAAALREIREETGVVGELGHDLGSVTYTDHRGRSKIVRWWAVEAQRQEDPSDTDEVDVMRWVDPSQAHGMLTYDTDRAVLARFTHHLTQVSATDAPDDASVEQR